MFYVKFKLDKTNEKESQYSRFKQNSSLKRDKSEDKYNNVNRSKIVLKFI